MNTPQHESATLGTTPLPQYELLQGHKRSDGSFKNTEQLHSEYIHLTDELIRQMTEGVSITNSQTGEKEQKKPDFVIWLDKSARPVSWLTKELWPLLAKEDDGTIPVLPEFRFVNIDREQWINKVDPNGSGFMDIDRIDESVIRSLRSIFIDPKYKKDGLTPGLDDSPSALDGKTVLIVDEVRSTGRTLEIASKFFKRAFPQADIAVTHWMSGLVQKGMAQGNADLPVWYKEQVESGRGVGNRDERKSLHSKSMTQRLGGWFLSTALKENDYNSHMLRNEFHQLTQAAIQHAVLVIPSTDRDDYIERTERLNSMSFDEFNKAKQALNS